MVEITKSQRTEVFPGGEVLPGGSVTDINIAGQEGRNLQAIGEAARVIGVKQQRIQDDLDKGEAELEAKKQAGEIIEKNRKTIENPKEFERVTAEEIKEAIETITESQNFRVKRNLRNTMGQITLSSSLATKAVSVKKTQGKADSLRINVKADILNTTLKGIRGGDPTARESGLQRIEEFLDNQVKNDVLSEKDRTKELNDYKKSVAIGGFKLEFLESPERAIEDLFKNPNLSEEQKIDLVDKAIRAKVNLDKRAMAQNKEDRDDRMIRYENEIRTNPDFDEDALIAEENRNPDNMLTATERRTVLNYLYRIEAAGGIGNPTASAELESRIILTPNEVTIPQMMSFMNEENFNNAQRTSALELYDKTVLRKDPNDPVNFSTSIELENDLKGRFAPGIGDPDFDKKKRGVTDAIKYYRAALRDEFRISKNADLAAANAHLKTLEYMAKRRKVLNELNLDIGEVSELERMERLETFVPSVEGEKRIREREELIEAERVKRVEREKVTREVSLEKSLQDLIDKLDSGEITEEEFDKESDRLIGNK